MRKQEITWIVVLVILAGLYVHFFTHWFEKQGISINASLRPSRRANAPVMPVYFTLNGDFKLTSLKVIPLDENGKFDPHATPVWNLTTDSNSVPTRAFRYGQTILGMKPALAGVRADALTPGVVYRMLLSAGEARGSKDFFTKPSLQN